MDLPHEPLLQLPPLTLPAFQPVIAHPRASDRDHPGRLPGPGLQLQRGCAGSILLPHVRDLVHLRANHAALCQEVGMRFACPNGCITPSIPATKQSVVLSMQQLVQQ